MSATIDTAVAVKDKARMLRREQIASIRLISAPAMVIRHGPASYFDPPPIASGCGRELKLSFNQGLTSATNRLSMAPMGRWEPFAP